jgi:rhodanese-related sulfurtransferase
MIMGFSRRAGIFAILAALCFATVTIRANGQFGAPADTSAFTIPHDQLMQPEELNRLLHGGGAKPLVLQVGSRMLFEQAHIPGAEYAGPGSQDAGLDQLKSRVAPLPRNTFIVLYCGCCPWGRCPNIAPAFNLLHGLRFTRVKVLYMAENFGTDWAAKGYPVERSR